MPLEYSQPEPGLARELREVARDANALIAALTRELNFELPRDFPKAQLLDICRSLAQLPDGTAEGCRAALDYARNRLPTIRREHILSEELDVPTRDAHAAPPVLRNSLIDERLSRLITSVTTALDAYRHLAAEAPKEEPKPEPAVAVSPELADQAVSQSERLEAGLTDATKIVEETTNPTSQRADSLKRQLFDGLGLNRLARAELRMPRVVVSWYRGVVSALNNLPDVIRHAANGIRIGVDIAEALVDRWHDFQRNHVRFYLDEIRRTADTLLVVADRLDGQKRAAVSVPVPKPDLAIPDNVEALAREMMLGGLALPDHWLPRIRELDFSNMRIQHIPTLDELPALQSLNLSDTRVSDLAPLAGLTALQSLDLTGTPVSDLAPLAGLTALQSLDLRFTQVSDLAPLAGLTALQRLDLTGTQVRDLAPLAGLPALQRLDLQHTPVSDLAPLAGLTALQSLDLRSTQVSDLAPLAGLTALQRLDLTGTQVRDPSPVAHVPQVIGPTQPQP